MNPFSYIAKDLPTIVGSPPTEQLQTSILPFQNWIDSLKIQDNLASCSGRTKSVERRNMSFTNGPYAEIKEAIGKFLPLKKHQEN